MKYLIKLEDRDMNRVVMMECQEEMTLEELYLKLKDRFFLSSDELGHSFQANGLVYVPRPEDVEKLWSKRREKFTSARARIQDRISRPEQEDILSSKDWRLNEVFTVKESVIVFQQRHRSYRSRIYCTLKDRVQ